MVQVFFDNIRSYDDLGLFLSKVSISAPESKRSKVSVPGRDGSLDMSYALSSDMKFENRELSIEFVMKDYGKDWVTDFSEIYNRIHGKRFRIVIGNDPEYYWEGFCEIDKAEDSVNKGTLKVICDVYPYKHRDMLIEVTSTSSGVSAYCPCGRETVCPVVTTSGNITITPAGGSAVHFDAGTRQSRDLLLREGVNILTITGNANVTLKYVEGVL